MTGSKLATIAFAAILGGLTLFNLFAPKRAFSESENRYLQQLPELTAQSLFSGAFTKDFETFITDQFPLRDAWVGAKTLTGLSLGKLDNGRVYFGKQGQLFEVHERLDEQQFTRNLQAVSAFLDKARAINPGLNASVMIVPTASQVRADLLPPYAPSFDQAPVLSRTQALLGDRAVCVDPTAALSALGDRAYYRTDHHWTAMGAYAAYTQWAGQVGLEPLPESRFAVQRVSTAFYGTTYSKANLFTIRPDEMYAYFDRDAQPLSVAYEGTLTDSLYDDAFLQKKDKYSYFLGGNHPLTDIRTGVGNGKTLLVVKDSYAHCFLPFLTSHYQRILAVDPRYYQAGLQDLIRDEGITDVLVLYNVINFTTDKNVPNAAK